MTTNVDITNRALAQIGSRSQITSMTDGSTEALYANLLYAPLRDFLLREGDYDFSMGTVTLIPIAGAPAPWLFAYQHPIQILRVRQLLVPGFNTLDPRPVEWNVAGNSAIGTPWILTKVPVTAALCTISVPEDIWDSMFEEAFTRFFSSALAFALENRIEASKEKLSEALDFAKAANMRDS